MKKRLFALVMVLAICLSMAGASLAAEPGSGITPYGLVLFSSGITQISGHNYKIWAIACPSIGDSVTVSFDLYKVVAGVEFYITSQSAYGSTSSVEAAEYRTLSPGTYKLYAWYYGTTESDSTVKTKTL
ncbi:MAG TPA: hypothetical protein VN512_00935 [Clostridia bacterium]|nr:hypothetical protein [Clostridia bacterium]